MMMMKYMKSLTLYFMLTCCIIHTLTQKVDITEETEGQEEGSAPSLVRQANDQDDESDRTEALESSINAQVLEDVFENCSRSVQSRRALEERLADLGRVVKLSDRIADPSLIRMKITDPEVHALEYSQLIFEKASEIIIDEYDITSSDVSRSLPDFRLAGELPIESQENCRNSLPTINCNRLSPYRTADGSCNNLQNTSWGMATECQQRLLDAHYVGASGYRVSISGDPLPLPRVLSVNLHYHLNRRTNFVTHMYMFYGQLLDHDIALTPQSTTVDNEAIQCCPPQNDTHPQCSPIIIPANDPFYSQYNITCLNFVRSAICPTCALGHRQQMDQITSFIDGSFVYGNSENETASLRDNGGFLRVLQTNVGDLLPQSPDPQNDQCSFPATNDICFVAGDSRANQHTVLTSLHTVFVRHHNYLVRSLRSINPQWNGERLFQESRRIIGAQLQAITYKEYLPITLGSDRMSYFRLWVSDYGYTTYDNRENPTMINEFTTAGFRFGHSMVNSIVAQYPLNATNGRRLLRDEFFQPFDLYSGSAGPLLEGSSSSPAQWFDRHLVPDLTNYLFRSRGEIPGLDLASFNINRGRDNGMPPYVHMVRFCSEGEIIVRNFDDLVNLGLMYRQQEQALRRNYRFVGDVDLWPGILMEIPNEGAVVGPTAACIIGIQFYKLKYGDRFYFEHGGQTGSFTRAQLQQIRLTTLSEIICLNSDAVEMTRNAMLFSSGDNPIISCRNMRRINLSPWRES